MPDLFALPHACRCESCCPDDPAPTYTRQWLIACLAREIAAMPSGSRADAVELYSGNRTDEFFHALSDAVRAELRKRDGDGGQSG